MALDQKFFKKSTSAGSGTDQEQGLFIYADANDVDSYDGDGSIWYDINRHELSIPLTDNNDNLEVHIDVSNTNSYPGYGSTITDISTNGYSFSPHGNATFGSDTKGYFTLDGSDDGLRSTDAITGFSGDLTFEWWFNASESNNFALLHANPASNDSGINGIFIGNAAGSAGAIEIYRKTTGGTLHSGQSSSTGLSGMASDGWVHFVITITSANVCKFYKDGSYKGTLTLNGNGTNHDTYNFVSIGGYNNASYEFSGKIGCFRMYSEILTASDIGQNYRAGNDFSYSSIIKSKHEATQGSLITVPATQGTIHTSNLQMNLLGSAYSSGATWSDSSGNGNNGTITGTPEYADGDGDGDYLTFDGDPRLTVSSFSELQSATAFTIEIWLRSSTATSDGMIWNVFDGGSGTKFSLSHNTSKFRWAVHNASGTFQSSQDVFTTNTFPTDTWLHIVATYNNGAEQKIYVDSVLEGAASNPNAGTNTTTTVQMRWGDRSDGYGVNTQIGQARFYNAALTAAQVRTNYNATKDLYQGATSLQLHLDANGYSSGNWSDTSGNNRNATISGNTAHTNDNNSDYFTLDGTGDYFTVAHNNVFNLDVDSTIEMWIWRSSTTNEQTLMHKGGHWSSGNAWFLNWTSGVGYYFYDYDTASLTKSGTAAAPLNEWTHLILSWNAGTRKAKMYINGTEPSYHTAPTDGSGSIGATNTADLAIGKAANDDLGTGHPAWNGRIAQVRFYKGAMTASQAKTNYDATKKLYQNPTALIDYRPDQYSGSGTSITNLGSLSNDAVLTGGIESTYDQELGNWFTIDGGSNTGDGIETTSNVTGVNLNTDGFSWEIWVNITADSFSYITSFNYSSTYYNFSYRANTDTIMFFNLGTTLNTPTLELNRWHHVVGTANSAGTKLYTNGVLSASNTTAAPNHNLDSKIYFGTYWGHSSADHIHTGLLGDGRFYKGVLTAEQVVQNYLATKNKYRNYNNFTLYSPDFKNSSVPYYFRFNAANDEARISSVDIDVSMGFTVSIYLKRHTAVSGYAQPFRITGTGYTTYLFMIAGYNDQIYYYSSGTGNEFSTYGSSGNWTDNSSAWRNIIFTRENDPAGSTTNRGQVYVNGSSHHTQTNLSAITNITNVYVNRDASYPTSRNAQVDVGLIKIWKKPFSDAEALAEYNATKDTYGL